MSDASPPIQPVPPPPPVQPPGVNLRLVLHIVYGLYALGFVTGGMGWLAAVVLCYVKKGDAAGTVYSSHFEWVLRTFWWSVLWFVVSALLALILIGWLGVFITLVWVLYRIIKGWLTLAEGRSIGALV